MFYLILALTAIIIIHPHLRFTLKTLPKFQLILSVILFALTISPMIASCLVAPESTIKDLAMFGNVDFAENIKTSLALFNFKSAENLFVLVPVISLPVVLIALTSLVLTFKNHHTSRNYILLAFVAFSVASLAFAPGLFIILLLPVAILVADGIQFLNEHWNMVFPNNSYAKFVGMLPIVVFTIFLACSSIVYHFFGYRSLKEVNMFYSTDLTLLRQTAKTSDIVIIPDDPLRLDFYRILEDKLQISVVDKMPDRIENQVLVFRESAEQLGNDLSLKEIITNNRYDDADRLYIFEK
jgi:hypothetical protein